MAIKKLQNNHTKPEQSKRLLELGLPADSADCYINEICNNRAFQLPDIFSKCTWLSKKKPIPCWSVGRLIEIYVYLTSYEYVSIIFKKTFTPMDKILDKLEKDITNGMLDFSKLEE